MKEWNNSLSEEQPYFEIPLFINHSFEVKYNLSLTGFGGSGTFLSFGISTDDWGAAFFSWGAVFFSCGTSAGAAGAAGFSPEGAVRFFS